MLKVSLDLLNVLDPIKQETAVIGSNTSTTSRLDGSPFSGTVKARRGG